ncbi:AraC family transcriptional regulator ligand-binding domain-containing protein [Rhizobium sp. TRM95111]|uniref:AraC family transcriptional regulator n=1 Tax=Rhizobium alarense TaxID=2846851 RepID=UPI001F240182|nr:AraC family transcriptional regulator ligand-binding domain-containing protein [Rhizobium alarense]MCF3641319.1 AraC family transcriptional regulator ligand-binding domain-containing protein [Rhizobium alarense]
MKTANSADALLSANRLPTVASIRASVLASLVHFIDRKSGKTDLLLAKHGILRSQLDDPYAVVPMARYVAFFEDAAAVLGDPAFGARLGTFSKPADIGPIGVLVSISPTIESGFRRLAKYVTAVQGATSSGVIAENGTVLWTYQLVDRALWPRRQDSEFTLAVTCQLLRTCFSRGFRPLEIRFEHPAPRDTGALERIFRAPLRFGQPANALVVAEADARRLYRTEDAGLSAVLERHIADHLGETDSGEGIARKVLHLIGIYLTHKPITIATMAAELGLSPRTLQRRLAEEGTSLRELLRQHRRTLAALHLAAGRVTKKHLAETLGYADQTVFWRAARSWGHDGTTTTGSVSRRRS